MKRQGVYSRLAIAMLSLAASACSAADNDSTDGVEGHFVLSEQATASDTGLPAYPGSTTYKEGDDSTSSANIRLSTSWFGFKVVAMNLESADKPEQVAAFYRQALSKYGKVVECTDRAEAGKQRESSGTTLSCEPDKSGSHSIVYKVGTDENQRIVAIKPHGSGTRFDLVHVDVRGKSKQ